MTCAAPLIDSHGRTISYLRVSVTDRCDLRCRYCMAEDMTFLPKKDLLSLEELDRLCSAFVARGVRKLRLTGGEPLVRKDVMTLFRSLSRHLDSGRLDELTLTTNGSQLRRHAADLAACGVKRINVSLDTLDPARFRAITRWGDLDQVLATLATIERELPSQTGHWYLMRLLPYRTTDDKIDGVTLTFIDITSMKHVQLERERLLQEVQSSTASSQHPPRMKAWRATPGRRACVVMVAVCNRSRMEREGSFRGRAQRWLDGLPGLRLYEAHA